jgi:hypothetical protein
VLLVLVLMPLATDGIQHTAGVSDTAGDHAAGAAASGVNVTASVNSIAGDDAMLMPLVPLPVVSVAPLVSMPLLV